TDQAMPHAVAKHSLGSADLAHKPLFIDRNNLTTPRPTTIRTTNESENFRQTNIIFPENLILTATPTTCEQHVLRINCPIADPLGTNEEVGTIDA
ncbi:hypothetical protein WA026_007796, partial [Henosepilachna vigintioctopunctata]